MGDWWTVGILVGIGVSIGVAVTGALLHELSSIPVIMISARLIGFKERTS